MELLWLLISIIPLLLVGGWAWIIRESGGRPDQRVIGVGLWLVIGLAVFSSLRLGGFSNLFASLTVVLVSTAGYLKPEFEKLISRIFGFPKTPETPAE